MSDQTLSNWNHGPSKKAILDFVEQTMTPGRASFVAVSERIAVFDTTASCGLRSRCPLN
jgi:hypothetical protein